MTNVTNVIAYSARTMCNSLRSSWSDARRLLYLLRPEVQTPLSVDTTVWPTTFGDNGLSLWPNLSELSQHLTSVPKAGVSSWIIAITTDDPHIQNRWRELEPVVPRTVEPSWLSLGFDIADEGMLSGLSNCGYDDGDFNESNTRAYWARYINAFHLINSHSIAQAFREWTDRRVKEHAPFGIYQLWLIATSTE